MDEKPLQACPQNFCELVIKTSHKIRLSKDDIWGRLSQKITFQKHQIFPYRVEFLNEDRSELCFKEGDYTNHHGPLLSANGCVTKMTHNTYRRLDYFYGSYVGSFRVFRPVTLEFLLASRKGEVYLDSTLVFYVHQSVPQWVKWIMRRVWSIFVAKFSK